MKEAFWVQDCQDDWNVNMINRLFIGCVLVASVTAITCHYSCSSCVSSLYSQCLSCPSTALTVIQNPNNTPSQYWPSVYPTGFCVETLAPASNILGILFVIIVGGVCIAVRTKQSFYLLLTLQTFGLFNLVEIAWVNPIGYVLQGLQHFMLMNTLGSGYKTDDYLLMASGNHRLHDYLKTSAAGPNLILLAVFSLVAIILLIVICIVTLRRKKQAPLEEKQVIFEAMLDQSEYDQQPQKEGAGAQASSSREEKDEEDEDKENCQCWRNFSEEVLIKVAKVCLCVLFLMVQETVLVLVVGLVWGSPVSVGLIVVCIIYLHLLIFIMSYAYYYRVQYFMEKKSMYVNFARKAVMPVLVVVPIRYQYLFFLFIGSFWLLELVIDCFNGLYRKMNRLAVYKCGETLTMLLLTVFYLVQRFGSGYAASRAAGIACTLMVALLFVLFSVETCLGIKQTYFSNKTKEEVKQTQQITLENIQPNKQQTIEVLSLQNSNRDKGEKAGKRDVIETSPGKDDKGRQDNATKDDNSSINYNTQLSNLDKKKKEEEEAEEKARQEAAQKKRRKQILDKELRMRYGI